jgi:hypothetical protein
MQSEPAKRDRTGMGLLRRRGFAGTLPLLWTAFKDKSCGDVILLGVSESNNSILKI